MPQTPNKICYLICVFNDQEGLKATLDSLFKDDPLADILIVDDGSQPEMLLPDIPEGFVVCLHTLPQNRGLIAALNEGLNWILERDYQYIARLDAGDLVTQGRLSAQLTYLEANPSIGILGTQLRAFDENDGRTLFEFHNPTGQKTVSHVLKTKNCLAHPSVMIRSDVFRDVGFYDPNFKYAEDYEMWRRIDKKYGVDNLSDIYVHKEIADGQMTAKNRTGSLLSKLKAQIKYFDVLDIWCWRGLARTCVALMIPRFILLWFKSGKGEQA